MFKKSLNIKGTHPSFLVKTFLKSFFLFICSEDRLGVDISIVVRMSLIEPRVKFLSISREFCFLENRRNFQYRGKFFKYTHQIFHERLFIKSLETKLSTFLGEKIYWSTLFLVFLKPVFHVYCRIVPSKTPL